MDKLFSVLFLLLVLTSCGSTYIIEGSSSVPRLDGKMVFIKAYEDGEWLSVDSAEVIHGAFSLQGKTDSVMFTSLYMSDENIMPVVLESGKIKVLIDYGQVSATGTPLNNALYEFIKTKNEMDIKIEELDSKEARMVMDGVGLKEIYEELNMEGEALVKEANDYVKKFISDNYDNILGPNVFLMLCNSLPYPVITPQIEDILKSAPYSFKSNDMVKEFVKKAKDNMQLIEEHQRMGEKASESKPAE